jgi:hypothetical protein
LPPHLGQGFSTQTPLGHTATERVQNPHDVCRVRRRRSRFDFPDALAVIAAVLLQDARAVGLEPGRKHGIELSSGAVEVSIGAPAEMFCAVENFLGPHLENHIGMRR